MVNPADFCRKCAHRCKRGVAQKEKQNSKRMLKSACVFLRFRSNTPVMRSSRIANSTERGGTAANSIERFVKIFSQINNGWRTRKNGIFRLIKKKRLFLIDETILSHRWNGFFSQKKRMLRGAIYVVKIFYHSCTYTK